ncbi:MAG: response regulator [Clostridiaceae bacterium]|nr:response regulator [Clostridiaceae bacterium]
MGSNKRIYKILVCDDEWMVRAGVAGVAAQIDEIELFQADSAAAALEILAEQEIDGLILDIRMPGMDGLEMLAVMEDMRAEVTVVILSGHDEFEYAQRAMKFGVSEYLLKPMTNIQTRTMLDSLIERIRRRKAISAEVERTKQQLAEIRPVIREQFYTDLINNRLEPERAAALATFLEIDPGSVSPAPKYRVILMRADPIHVPGIQTLETERLRVFTTWEIVRERLPSIWRQYSFSVGADILGLVAMDAYVRDIEDFLAEVGKQLESIGAEFLLNFSVGVGGSESEWSDFRRSYNEALLALNSGRTGRESCTDHLSTHEINLTYIEDLQPGGVNNTIRELNLTATISDAALDGSVVAVEKLIELKEQIFTRQDITLDEAVATISLIITMALGKYRFSGVSREEIEKMLSLNPVSLVASQHTLQDLHTVATSILNTILRDVSSATERNAQRIVRECKEYINREYAGDVGLEELSTHLRLSKNYIGQVFRREMGYGVIDYLNRVRINHAKQLLRETALKIYEIAERTGFRDSYYFSNTFKRIVGVAPREYRESI